MFGEMYWEFARFAPYVIWKRTKQYKNRSDIKFINITRPENFDIYGRYASILVPFILKDESKYRSNCFRLDNITNEEYISIIKSFKDQFKDRYNILETIYPDISKHQFGNKNQFPKDKMNYNYLPRISNSEVIKKYMNGKPVVILAPRYRAGFRRNWPYWNELYNLISNNQKLIDKYNFVICGRSPDYVPDYKNRFLDVNKMDQNINISLIGLTMTCMKKAVLTVGSQSAIPNISLLFGVHALEWGHQKHLHTVTYNVKKTKVTFLEDNDYTIKPKIVFQEMLKILN
jgi:hypothetical protein